MLLFLLGLAVAAAVFVPVTYFIARRAAYRIKSEQNAQKEESERLRSLGRLAGGLVHEIKNPLGTMVLNLGLLREDWSKSREVREKRALSRLETIEKEAKRLEQILDDFLAYVKGKKPNLQERQVAEVIDEVLDFFAPQARTKRIEVRKNYAPHLPNCLIDADLFKQALINLLRNSQEAMPQGGELMIKAAKSNKALRIDITDTGEGIAPETLEHIFDAYYSSKKTGTGLGLATTKRIIEDHGGTISIQSQPGKGTNVTISLPCQD
jgi:signal transduction histidine kinase